MAYHPQSDGPAEKGNATLETFLKAYIMQLKSPEQWTWLLPQVEFTYNVVKHKVTGMSPLEADIGYDPRLVLDLLILGQRMQVPKPGVESADRLIKILQMLWERMEETQLVMVSDVNEHRRLHPFHIGDSVFLVTRLLPVGYANLNSMCNDGVHSRKFQIPTPDYLISKKWW